MLVTSDTEGTTCLPDVRLLQEGVGLECSALSRLLLLGTQGRTRGTSFHRAFGGERVFASKRETGTPTPIFQRTCFHTLDKLLSFCPVPCFVKWGKMTFPDDHKRKKEEVIALFVEVCSSLHP